MLGYYEIGTSRQFIPSYQRRRITSDAIYWDQEPDLPATTGQRMTVTCEEDKNSIIGSDLSGVGILIKCASDRLAGRVTVGVAESHLKLESRTGR